MNKVFIPLNDYKNIGGPTTFMKNLSKYFDENGIQYTTNEDDGDKILFPIEYNKKTLKKYRAQNKSIIQRLDGVVGFPWDTFKGVTHFLRKTRYEHDWIGPKKELKFLLDMIKIYDIYKNYSTDIIFQSNYCRDLCFEMLGEKAKNEYSIIYNGVHTDIFYPGTRERNEIFVFSMSGRFRRNDMILPALDALDKLSDKYKFELHVVGPIENNYLKNEINSRKYVRHFGNMDQQELAKFLRASDAYIFLSLNAPCPNSLLEAVSSGLPVISFDYGSIPELLEFSPDLIAETKPSINTLMKGGEHLILESLVEKIEVLLNNFQKYKEISMTNTDKYNFVKCGREYSNKIK